jgi:hypothetical protein
MGTGCRIFLFDDNGSLQRLSMARLDRLLRFDRGESLPHFGGKRVRFARVFLETAERQILAITQIDYFLLSFDAKGRINRKDWERGMHLGLELLPPLPMINTPSKSWMLGIGLPRGVMNTSSSGGRVGKKRGQSWLPYSANEAVLLRKEEPWGL